MNIGIEARWAALQTTGFGRYVRGLLRHLGQVDRNNDYVVYSNRDYQDPRVFGHRNFQKRLIPYRPEIYKHLLIPLDIILGRHKIDLFHFPYNAPSLFFPVPYVVTVHDVSFKHFPEMLSAKDRFSITLQFRLNLHRASQIITVSENSKRDIVEFYGIPEEKIVVIYEGVDKCFRVMTEESRKEEVSRKYGLPKTFLLYVGTSLPHKNLNTLIRAFSDLKRHFDIPHSLVLAGAQKRRDNATSRLVADLDLESSVKTIGFVSDEDLPVVYNLCDIFVFPSLYEGFGLPILEAMACGVPVLSSNASCLPEIGGDAAIYFAAQDVQHLVRKVRAVLNDSELRLTCIDKGFQRVRQFTWAKTAEKTLQSYESTIELARSHATTTRSNSFKWKRS